MKPAVLIFHGAAGVSRPLVLDSPHSSHTMPTDFDSARTEAELQDSEDCFVNKPYRPAAARGVPLLAALFPRTYLDPARSALGA